MSGTPPAGSTPSNFTPGVPSAQFAQLFAQLTTALNAIDTDSKANAQLIATTIGDALTAQGGAYETGSWTPSVTFGGFSTGTGYLFQDGLYIKLYRLVVAIFQMSLTAVGSSTGAAVITGLPFSSNAVGAMQGSGGISPINSGMASLTGPVLLRVGQSSALIQLFTQGVAGITALTDANFTNSSAIGGVVVYFT